jgi:hypothetical protein
MVMGMKKITLAGSHKMCPNWPACGEPHAWGGYRTVRHGHVSYVCDGAHDPIEYSRGSAEWLCHAVYMIQVPTCAGVPDASE